MAGSSLQNGKRGMACSSPANAAWHAVLLLRENLRVGEIIVLDFPRQAKKSKLAGTSFATSHSTMEIFVHNSR